MLSTTPAASQPYPDRLLRIWDICRIPEVSETKAAENRARRDAARRAGDRKKGAKNTRHAGRIVKPRPAREGLLPLSPAAWWAGVKSGRYPQPVRLGRITAWRESDILALVEKGV